MNIYSYLCTTRTRQASQRCSNVRVVFFTSTLMTTTPTLFTAPFRNVHDLVQLLMTRGLIIDDQHNAERYLSTIGYYRLSEYMIPLMSFPKSQKRFKPGTSFRQAMMLYRFDKKLRMLIFNEIEKVEVAIRSTIVNTICELTGDRTIMEVDTKNMISLCDRMYFRSKS